MEQALVQIPEVAFHITGFAGPLLLLDKAVFAASCILHVLVAAFLLVGRAYIWFGTLIAIFLLAITDGVVLRLRGEEIMMRDRSIRRFMYGIPLAFFCFYSSSLIRTREQSHCSWNITVDNPDFRVATKVGTYVAGAVVLLSMSLAALRMDCNGSASVSRRVRQGRWYALCHVSFRATELSFRLGTGVVLCESLRVQPVAVQVGLPVFLCLPFFCLVCLYTLALQAANAKGGKPTDDPVACVVAGVVTLAMNPMHFFARPGYDAVVRRANKSLFMIRVLEVVGAAGFIYETAANVTTPEHLCDTRLKGLDIIRALGPLAMCQVLLSLAVHYLVMALHSDIQHSTCQALTRDEPGDGPRARIPFPRPAQQSLYVPPPPAFAGLGRAWAQLGGGLPLAPFEERPAEQLDEYRIRKVLGWGSFGVAVKVEALPPNGGGEPQAFAMKLLSTSGETPEHRQRMRMLAEREAAIYSRIWLHGDGHPNVVRLHFWSQFEQGRKFYMDECGEEVPLTHPTKGWDRFHMALMMELCEMNLEKYLEQHHRPTAEWFALAVHLLAEMQSALAFLHSSVNVTYRDLKPENVLIVGNPLPDVHCKLADFGYGRVVDPDADAHRVSVAGTPFFIAPEMEDNYHRRPPLVATEAEEKALDTYSYGSVAYALAFGPGYITKGNTLGERDDHPRCQRVGPTRCQQCTGCRLLQRVQRQLAPSDPSGHLADMIGRCVERQAARRPAVVALQGDALFQGVDFDALVQQ